MHCTTSSASSQRPSQSTALSKTKLAETPQSTQTPQSMALFTTKLAEMTQSAPTTVVGISKTSQVASLIECCSPSQSPFDEKTVIVTPGVMAGHYVPFITPMKSPEGQLYPWIISSRVSRNSGANTSEFLLNLEENCLYKLTLYVALMYFHNFPSRP